MKDKHYIKLELTIYSCDINYFWLEEHEDKTDKYSHGEATIPYYKFSESEWLDPGFTEDELTDALNKITSEIAQHNKGDGMSNVIRYDWALIDTQTDEKMLSEEVSMSPDDEFTEENCAYRIIREMGFEAERNNPVEKMRVDTIRKQHKIIGEFEKFWKELDNEKAVELVQKFKQDGIMP